MHLVEFQAVDPHPSKGPMINVRAVTVQCHCLAPPGESPSSLPPPHPQSPNSPNYGPAVATTWMPSVPFPNPPPPRHHLWEALPGFSRWGGTGGSRVPFRRVKTASQDLLT